MRINTMLMRPSMLPSAVCAPSALLPVAAPSALLAAERVLAPQAHQVFSQSQAELGKWAVERVLASGVKGSTGINGTTGFKGNDSVKRYTDGNGVPPRGRPV
ncbi:hypothetical protein ACWT_7480 [Actinoplanes sp. SE50]|uniref:hypothetical protein n=1 Tax=unclassified Actinoplanes TaxID=2626549 RepID=UPI00023EDC93|nr:MULTISPECIES: hypothetical protein [unclassified Actinoplanes]AEV88490.1 hypothetical protein ACPL_7610 [Actinoplanes sp. SE50/110]ATO86895.1 hypothetical protein ACWT_7480 [Actinoplanes sp. SE50]SLM04313.1 hypothetical protein ACSP50_7618 [Actinoplanes sp. SE50/110]